MSNYFRACGARGGCGACAFYHRPKKFICVTDTVKMQVYNQLEKIIIWEVFSKLLEILSKSV
jgi:hypothetical protein